MKKTIKMVLLTICVLAAHNLQAEGGYKKVTVCQVLHAGKTFKGRHVQFAANAVSDGKHGSMLTDVRCPNRGLLLDASQTDADPSVASLRQALWSDGSPGTTGRRVTGVFFGSLMWDREGRELRFVVQRVDNLQNVRIAPKISDLP
jgi:hypothetical protein